MFEHEEDLRIDDQRIFEAQRQFFGERYVGATLSKIVCPKDASFYQNLLKLAEIREKICLIQGPPGVGKTFICSAALEYFCKKFRTFRAYNERSFLSKIRESIGGSSDYIRYLHEIIDDDLVIFDDFGSSGVNEWRKEVLFEFVDFRYCLPSKFTIIATNLTKEEIYKDYGYRIGSRIFAKENLIIDLEDMPDMREIGS